MWKIYYFVSQGNRSYRRRRISRYKSFDGTIRYINDRPLIDNDEQLKMWKGYFTTAFNCIISSEIPPLVDEVAR